LDEPRQQPRSELVCTQKSGDAEEVQDVLAINQLKTILQSVTA
jgi:hypothetical protein